MKACILCNGEAPTKALFEETVAHSTVFIACDGAAHLALTYHMNPDYIVGDLDSLNPTLRNHAHVRYVENQNSNDLQKALELAKSIGVSETIVLGASGLRFDHFLTNLYVISNFAQEMRIHLKDTYGNAWIANRFERLQERAKTPISLFALGDTPVTELTLSGLQYPLNRATLAPGSPMAALNYTTAHETIITHKQGLLLIYVANTVY